MKLGCYASGFPSVASTYKFCGGFMLFQDVPKACHTLAYEFEFSVRLDRGAGAASANARHHAGC
jgi:hypothetical protein